MKRRGDNWRARYYDNEGHERQRTFRTKGEGDRWLREQLAALSRGDYVDPAAGSVTFADYAAQWLEHQHVRRSSRELMERRIRLQLNPVLGAVPLRAIRRSHVVAMVTRCSTECGLSVSVTRHAMSMVRAILDAAVADRLIPGNVARDKTISLPRATRAKQGTVSADQVAAIATGIDGRHRALVVLGAASGLRPGEAFGLTADRLSPPIHLAGDVLPQQVTIRVDRQAGPGDTFVAPKTASSVREVTVPASVVATLVDHVRRYGLGPDGLLFTTASGRMITRARASEIWRQATVGLDLPPGATWHDLRHYHASALLSAGISIAYVAKRLGHANPSITLSLYAWAMPADEERVLAASDGIALAVGSPHDQRSDHLPRQLPG